MMVPNQFHPWYTHHQVILSNKMKSTQTVPKPYPIYHRPNMYMATMTIPPGNLGPIFGGTAAPEKVLVKGGAVAMELAMMLPAPVGLVRDGRTAVVGVSVVSLRQFTCSEEYA